MGGEEAVALADGKQGCAGIQAHAQVGFSSSLFLPGEIIEQYPDLLHPRTGARGCLLPALLDPFSCLGRAAAPVEPGEGGWRRQPDIYVSAKAAFRRSD